jgi:hypothetical protein
MAQSVASCPSCRKLDKGNGRYCIYCGSILKPVYCSHCGTVNPEDLERCMECGNSIPKLTDAGWGQIATVMQPTSTMSNEKPYATYPNPEASQSNPRPSGKSLFSRLRARLNRKEQPTD